ncbi:MAG: tetratricopeptide repeat protein, partial [Candidatus Eisenbacteria bacterium]|nr:tetratricopeptide repeat protein [Candidatus Eisenbacteria bacterium]
MSTWKLFLVSFILSSTLLAGCSGGPKPQHLFKQGDYKTALALYQERAERLPDNAETFRAIGACQYELGDVTAALASLEKAHELDSKDASTLFLLGRVNEKLNDPGSALAAYTAYMERKPDAVEVSARMNLLRRQMLEKQTQILVAREGMMTATPPSRLTLAVFDFENLSPDSLLTPLGKGLAAMLITDLSQADSLRLVERQRLQVLLDELGMTHAAPPAGTPAD